MIILTPALLLRAYAVGIFPMAQSASDPEIFWIDPEKRGILPLDAFHLPSRLRRRLRSDAFEVVADRSFDEVIRACAAPRKQQGDTWINEEIAHLYGALYREGHAHSIESWQGGELVGGLYGVALGSAFFGESMFSRVTDASKVALAHLAARLRLGGFCLLDTQFITEHLKQFGAIEIDRVDYHRLLATALGKDVRFPEASLTGAEVVALLTPPSPPLGPPGNPAQ
ncbi:MAG TPA: leucyl/phenylalanyl-tRNA--protein transferase [Stellaceae bacterium]|nr:leucyl/phenylalanyl-tRNA--protein transferase [Stellaceae bacterium]